MSTLRELTAAAHKKAEDTVFMRLLMAKAIREDEYMNYLTQITLIYTGLEYVGEKIGLLSEMPGISRLENVRADLAELNNRLGTRSKLQFETTHYYNTILDMTDRDTILGHFYVRYAGDMYGGQMLKALVPGGGKLYEFGDKLPMLRQRMREIATPNLAPHANDAFKHTIEIVNSILNWRSSSTMFLR
jgi:heme oxygenase